MDLRREPVAQFDGEGVGYQGRQTRRRDPCSGEKTPLRASSSDVATFHTANSVLPRTYSHRSTTVPRTDFLLKSGLSSSVTGANSNDFGRASRPMFE